MKNNDNTTNNKGNTDIEMGIQEDSQSDISFNVRCGSMLGADEEVIEETESLLSEYLKVKLLRGFEKGASSKIFTLELSSPLIEEGDVMHIPYHEVIEEVQSKAKKEKVVNKIRKYIPIRNLDLELILDEAEMLLYRKDYEIVNELELLSTNSTSGEEVERYKVEIINFIKDNEEQIAEFSNNTFEKDKHVGVWLDGGKYKRKYGRNSIAIATEFLVNKIFVEGEINDEGFGSQIGKAKRGEILDKLIEIGFIKRATIKRRDEYMNFREDDPFNKLGAYIFNIDKLDLNNDIQSEKVS